MNWNGHRKGGITVWFEFIMAKLEWLEPEQFFAGAWVYVCGLTGTDGERYDIVRSVDGTDMRYTTV